MDLLLNGLYIFLGFIFVITLVVFVHELGHFLVARLNGVKVEVFSIGLGREIFGFYDRHGTRWRISLIPVGGYIKMMGDSSVADHQEIAIDAATTSTNSASFNSKKVWQKILIVLAGPLANFIFAIVIFTLMFWVGGRMVSLPIIDEVIQDSPANKAGIKVNDQILALDGKEIFLADDVSRYIQLTSVQSILFNVNRADKVIDIMVYPEQKLINDLLGNTQCVRQVGIRFTSPVLKEFSFSQSFVSGVMQTYQITADSLKAIYQIVIGERSAKQLQGIISTARVSGEVAKIGLSSLLLLAAFLSVAIGLFNLFPIPLLDGGHLLFYAIELLRGKPLSIKVHEILFRVGVILIALIFILALYNDITGVLKIDQVIKC